MSTKINDSGITFPDDTVQNTAFLGDGGSAPLATQFFTATTNLTGPNTTNATSSSKWPKDATAFIVMANGGSGGGGGYTGNIWRNGGTGGSGAWTMILGSISESGTIAMTMGAGGSAGSSTGSGGSGGSTTISQGGITLATSVGGGGGGPGANNYGTPGTSGARTDCNFHRALVVGGGGGHKDFLNGSPIAATAGSSGNLHILWF